MQQNFDLCDWKLLNKRLFSLYVFIYKGLHLSLFSQRRRTRYFLTSCSLLVLMIQLGEFLTHPSLGSALNASYLIEWDFYFWSSGQPKALLLHVFGQQESVAGVAVSKSILYPTTVSCSLAGQICASKCHSADVMFMLTSPLCLTLSGLWPFDP